jgi:hypothetical protein
MDRESFSRIHIIENKVVNLVRMAKWRKTRGEKMQVTSIMLLKTNIEKMPENRLSIMLLKVS